MKHLSTPSLTRFDSSLTAFIKARDRITFCGHIVTDLQDGPSEEVCGSCAAIDAEMRLGGRVPVICNNCQGTGNNRSQTSSATLCPHCMGAKFHQMKPPRFNKAFL